MTIYRNFKNKEKSLYVPNKRLEKITRDTGKSIHKDWILMVLKELGAPRWIALLLAALWGYFELVVDTLK